MYFLILTYLRISTSIYILLYPPCSIGFPSNLFRLRSTHSVNFLGSSNSPLVCHLKLLSAVLEFGSQDQLALLQIPVDQDLFVLYFRRAEIQGWINNNWSFENSIRLCSPCGLATRLGTRARSITWRLWIPELGDSAHRNEEEGRMLLKLHIIKFCFNGYISRNHTLVLKQLGTNLFLWSELVSQKEYFSYSK